MSKVTVVNNGGQLTTVRGGLKKAAKHGEPIAVLPHRGDTALVQWRQHRWLPAISRMLCRGEKGTVGVRNLCILDMLM